MPARREVERVAVERRFSGHGGPLEQRIGAEIGRTRSLIVEATIAAHLVALGEAAGVGAKEINRRLKQIADDTVLDEIWITDEKGHAYLRNNTEIDFTFSPDRQRQPQAHAFWPLLTGKNKAVVQEARQVPSAGPVS